MTKATLEDCEAYIKRFEPEETQVPGYLSVNGIHSFCYFFIIINNLFNLFSIIYFRLQQNVNVN